MINLLFSAIVLLFYSQDWQKHQQDWHKHIDAEKQYQKLIIFEDFLYKKNIITLPKFLTVKLANKQKQSH